MRLRLGKDGDFFAYPLAEAIPKAAVAREVVITRKQPPAAFVSGHARDRLHDRPILRAFGVEDVTGHQDMLRALFGRRPAKRIDHVEARLGERGANVGLEAAIGFAELPVGGVNELHCALIAA